MNGEHKTLGVKVSSNSLLVAFIAFLGFISLYDLTSEIANSDNSNSHGMIFLSIHAAIIIFSILAIVSFRSERFKLASSVFFMVYVAGFFLKKLTEYL